MAHASPFPKVGRALRNNRSWVWLVGCGVLLCTGPLLAHAVSSWNPTLIVNTEAFQVIDDADATSNMELRFGTTLNARIAFDRSADRFDFSKSVFVHGDLTLTGSLALTSVTNSGGVVYSSGSDLRVTPTGAQGQLLLSQGTLSPTWATPTGGMVWYLDGLLVVGASRGAVVKMPFAVTLSGVTLNVKGSPTGAALIVDIKNNGSTIFGTKPQVNAGMSVGGTGAVLSQSLLPVNATVSLDVTQVGSTFAGSGLTVILSGVRKY